MLEPIRIEPDALYDDGSLYQAIGVSPATLAAARNAGVLRHARTGKRTLYKGEWVLSWLEAAATASERRQAPRKEGGGR